MPGKTLAAIGIAAFAVVGIWIATALVPGRAQDPRPGSSGALVTAVRAPAGHRLEMSYSQQDGSTSRSDTVTVSSIELYPNYIVYHYEGGSGGGVLFREKMWSLRWIARAIPRPEEAKTDKIEEKKGPK